MKYGFKKLLALTVALALLIGMLAMPGWAQPVTIVIPDSTEDPDVGTLSGEVISSGHCGGEGDGTNLSWELTSDGVLTISGEGAMADWGSVEAPWFGRCSSIKTVVIGDGVTTVGSYAFFDCTGLTEVDIPTSVTTIGEWAFSYCTALTAVDIPVSVGTIGYAAFTGCTGLAAIRVDGDNPSYSSDSTGVLFNKDKTALIQAPGALSGSYTVPVLVTTIGADAFFCCTGLTAVDIPASVDTIGIYAFAACTSLSEIRFLGNAPALGDDVFYNVTATAYYPAWSDSWTEEVRQNYGGTLTWTGADTTPGIVAFGHCGGEGDGTNLTWELVADGVLTISGVGTMADWSSSESPWYSRRNSIKTVVIDDGVTTIGGSAFYNHTELTAVEIPASVTEIGYAAFRACAGLTAVDISDSVTTIGSYVFFECTSLTAITVDGDNPNYSSDSAGVLFDKNKTTLIQAPGAISGSYAIPTSVTAISGYSFFGCTGLTAVDMGASVTAVGRYAFFDCTGLTAVEIGSSVTTIGESAFRNCTGLTAVDIPASVATIEGFTFYSCTGLTEVRFLGDAPALDDYVFYGITATAYYPAWSDSWTEEVRQNYGGTLTWVPFEAAVRGDTVTATEAVVTVQYDPSVAETVTAILVIYHKDGRLLRTETVTEQANADGTFDLSISYTEEEYAEIGRISAFVIDGDTMVPLCANWDSLPEG